MFPGFQSRAGYPSSGPAAGGGYVLPARPKVKVRRKTGGRAFKLSLWTWRGPLYGQLGNARVPLAISYLRNLSTKTKEGAANG